MRNVSSVRKNGDDQRRFDHRQRDPDELLPGGRPVDLGRLIDRRRNGLQPGEGQQPDERSGLPGVGDHDRPERCPGIGEPENLATENRFITPDESKMSFHIRAETIVGIAQGTKMPARTRPRPRKALAMIRPSPRQ